MGSKITTIILAGGRGSRMGGGDKGLLSWRNKALVEHVLERIQPDPGRLIISCNRHLDEYRKLAATVCIDTLPDYQGPLAGIQAALALSTTELNLVCACDTPYLPADLLSRLQKCMALSNAELCYPDDGEREHFLPVLLKSTLQENLGKYLKAGDRSIKGWYRQLRVSTADFSDCPEGFINLNDKKTLDANI